MKLSVSVSVALILLAGSVNEVWSKPKNTPKKPNECIKLLDQLKKAEKKNRKNRNQAQVDAIFKQLQDKKCLGDHHEKD